MHASFTQVFEQFLEKVKDISMDHREICVVKLKDDETNYFVRLFVDKGQLNFLSIYEGHQGFESLMDYFGSVERPDLLQRASHYVIYREENLENVPPDILESSKEYYIQGFEASKEYLFLNKPFGKLEVPLTKENIMLIHRVMQVLIEGNLNQIKFIKKIGYDQKFTHFIGKETDVTLKKKRIDFNYPRYKGNEFKAYGLKKKCQQMPDYWFLTDTFTPEPFKDEGAGFKEGSFLRSIILLTDDGYVQEHREITYKDDYLKSVLKMIEDQMERDEIRPSFIITDHRPLAKGLKDFLKLYDITLIYDALNPVLVQYRDSFMDMMAEEDFMDDDMRDEMLFNAFLLGENMDPVILEKMTEKEIEHLFDRFDHRIEEISESLMVRMEQDEFSEIHPEDIEEVIFDEMIEILLKG